jgi:hypothetical protein
LYITACCGDLIAQSPGIMASRNVQKQIPYKKCNQSLPGSTRPQTSNEFPLSWKENCLIFSVNITCNLFWTANHKDVTASESSTVGYEEYKFPQAI